MTILRGLPYALFAISFFIFLSCSKPTDTVTTDESLFKNDPEYSKFTESLANFKFATAYQVACSIVQKHPANATAWIARGYVCEQLDKTAEAHDSYQKAVLVNPHHSRAWFNLGAYLGNLGEVNREIEYYNKAIELNPKYALAYYQLGRAHADKGDSKKANELILKAIELDPMLVKNQLAGEPDSTNDPAPKPEGNASPRP